MKKILSIAFVVAATMALLCGNAFAADTTCTHTNIGDIKDPKVATCEENGNTAGVQCFDCGKIITPVTYTAPTGHKYTEYTVNYEATCEKNGEKMRICETCGKEQTAAIIKLGHKFTILDKENSVAATCQAKGNNVYNCANENCDATKNVATQKIDHNVTKKVDSKAATCEEDGYDVFVCTMCNGQEKKVTVAKLGHNMTVEIEKVDPVKCISDGSRTMKCSRCDKQETKTIGKAAHTPVKDEDIALDIVKKPATSTSNAILFQVCDVCHEVLYNEPTYVATSYKYQTTANKFQTILKETTDTVGTIANTTASLTGSVSSMMNSILSFKNNLNNFVLNIGVWTPVTR